MLMSANFGSKSAFKHSDRKPSAASSARPLNFYKEAQSSVPKYTGLLSPAVEDDQESKISPNVNGFGQPDSAMNHDRVMFQSNYKVKPHKEDLKHAFVNKRAA